MRKRIITLVLTISFFSYGTSSYSQTNSNNQKQKVNLPISVQEDPNNQLGLVYWANKLEDAKNFLNDNKLEEAGKILLSTKDWLTDATEYHFNLFETLSNNSKTSDFSKIEKAHALDYGELRDKAYLLLAKLYIKQNKLKDAVKLLVTIIKSQPDSDLGLEAYKILQEIKFSDKT